MGRAPCCDKVGLKKGPWTSEEDQILVSFIQMHGHSNWRALPKQAGLLRCGKSCRLRWINYLRPDIKRGNFTKEEEDTIIQLHEIMGNRWSAIAARLPGRTDNEIKNVWHTHLKKKLKQYEPNTKSKMTKKRPSEPNNLTCSHNSSSTTTTTTTSANTFPQTSAPNSSSQQSFSSDDFSSVTEVSSSGHPSNNYNMPISMEDAQNHEDYAIIDDTFWSAEDFTYEVDDISMNSLFPNMTAQDNENNQIVQQLETHDNEEENIITTTTTTSSDACHNFSTMYSENSSLNYGDSLDFWLDVFVKAGGAPELPEF